MIVVISPAKTLDFETQVDHHLCEAPEFAKTSLQLISELKKLEIEDIARLMKLSDNLARLNFERFQNFQPNFTLKNSKPAAYAFKGDTYIGLEFDSLKSKEVIYAQKHLRILSGLYGLLKPLDLIQPYRLEMGTKFKNSLGKDLYELWHKTITEKLNEELLQEKVLVNLASQEYFGAVDAKKIQGTIVTPAFMEKKGTNYKVISFNAKRARGMMSRFIIQNKITKPEELLSFDLDHYKYNPKLSGPLTPVFTR
jgi:uncharacterized protein